MHFPKLLFLSLPMLLSDMTYINIVKIIIIS